MLKHVKELHSHHDIWRCIYFNLNNANLKYQHELHDHFVVEHLERLLEDVEGEVFLCEDGDVFILFKGALLPVIRKLSTHFKGMMPEPLWKQPSDDVYTIFDLSRYWQLFFNLCRAKYNKEDHSEKDVLEKPVNIPANNNAPIENMDRGGNIH